MPRNIVLKILVGFIILFLSIFLGSHKILAAEEESFDEQEIIQYSSGDVLITEVEYNPVGLEPDGEWIEIYNPNSSPVDLTGFKIGDEETKGGGEGMYKFPNGANIAANSFLIIANKAIAFKSSYGRNPDFELTDSDITVPDLIKYSTWATGSINLANDGDEVLLLDNSDKVIGAVVYGKGSFDGITSHPGVIEGYSIERVPVNSDSDNCAMDFIDQRHPSPGMSPVLLDPASNISHNSLKLSWSEYNFSDFQKFEI